MKESEYETKEQYDDYEANPEESPEKFEKIIPDQIKSILNTAFFKIDYEEMNSKLFKRFWLKMRKMNHSNDVSNDFLNGNGKYLNEYCNDRNDAIAASEKRIAKKLYFEDQSTFRQIQNKKIEEDEPAINKSDHKPEEETCTPHEGKGIIRNCISSLQDDVNRLSNLLSKKRKMLTPDKESDSMENVYDPYEKFLAMFHQNLSIDEVGWIVYAKDNITNHNSFQYMFHKMKDYVFGKVRTSMPKSQKVIGLSPSQIYSQPKYQIDIQNMPKFTRNFDKMSQEIEYSSTKGRNYIPTLIEASLDMKSKKKHQTLSFIERQNKEALQAIEEKRLKFKNLPKSNKEKMDMNNLHKHWNWIVKKEIPKNYKNYQKVKSDADYNCKKFSTLAQKEIKKKVNKVQRCQKEFNIRAKRLQKEMIVFWRKRDKEILDLKKKKDKIEVDKKKKEEELQEAIIQKKRFEYLMKQSDIYSYYMFKNLGVIDQAQADQDDEMKKDNDSMKDEDNTNKQQAVAPSASKSILSQAKPAVIANNEVLLHPKTNKIIFQSIRVDIDEKAAKEGVKQMITKQREKVTKFDQQINIIRQTLGGDEVNVKTFDECKEEDLQIERLDKPMINNTSSQLIEAPKSFIGELKEYQLKGLRWLDNLYEQGINGILADEMGLGKTIQAIAFLAHLTEEKNNWGPFLVVAPNATLYNWQQEINRFCPSLKVLPYWGGLKERKTLRKFFNSNQLYVKSSSFHICVSSYQLVVSDEKVFHRVGWQYMILDEAQAIKNINSQRWNTLLSFNCRNRLLLTGTPIQNSMSELWALLHFIMPNLFDSHEQFQEWFSKDIEAHSQEKGELNQEQLKRLHKILKPFMLRRIKKDVEHEIGPKIEYEIPCEMTERQRVLYNSIKEKLSTISDLFTSTDSKVKVENLMNLVMQFRKVCNHPELFERNIGKVPFTFRDLIMERTSTFVSSSGETELRAFSHGIIQYTLPKLIYDQLYRCHENPIAKKLTIYTYENMIPNSKKLSNIFNFVGLLNFSVREFLSLLRMGKIFAQICLFHYLNRLSQKRYYLKRERVATSVNIFINQGIFPINDELSFFYNQHQVFPAMDDVYTNLHSICTLEPLITMSLLQLKESISRQLMRHRCYIPKVTAPLQEIVCSSGRVNIQVNQEINNIVFNKLLYGISFKQPHVSYYKEMEKYLSWIGINSEESLEKGLLTDLFYQNGGYTQIELPSFERLIADCAKLKKFDELLEKLYRENHRVLVFCQMTRMIDILEEYMAKKRHTYFRMDGSTNIADRRDMVNEFQTNDKVFAFLLSTRAGGLGVNLTGADTVIFYDNDWNPTMDAQATDRAHRIGQSKMVSVYRLVTANTIEERILKRAKQKQNVQTTVYSGGAFKADIFKQSEIVELLYSEEEMKKMELERKRLLMELNSSGNTALNLNEKKDIIMENINDNTLISSKKRISKKGKKAEGSNIKGKKKIKKEDKDSTGEKSPVSEVLNTKVQNPLLKSGPMRNIFSVSTGSQNPSKQLVNALKVDSSDDENNVIIQEGDNPINIEGDEIFDE